MTDLGVLPGGMFSGAVGINARGDAVGISDDSSGFGRAVLWDRSSITELQSLGETVSFANDINSAGQIVGMSRTSDGFDRAVLWTK